MLAVLASAGLIVGGCRGASEPSEHVIDRTPSEQGLAVPLTLEEAGLLASGALIDIYGIEADPVPVRVEDSQDLLGGQTMWLLDLTVDVSVDGNRSRHLWRMWVGAPVEGPPAVIRAQRID